MTTCNREVFLMPLFIIIMYFPFNDLYSNLFLRIFIFSVWALAELVVGGLFMSHSGSFGFVTLSL